MLAVGIVPDMVTQLGRAERLERALRQI